jgi:hypothetical protein
VIQMSMIATRITCLLFPLMTNVAFAI